MTNLQRKFTTALATGAVLANAFVPVAFADTNLTISGNGSHSDSDINVNNNNDTTVKQDNHSNTTNTIKVNSNTGGNSASDNTTGDVRIDTGDAKSTIAVDNKGNINVADVEGCGGCVGDTTVKISGNGTDSDNKVDVDNDNDVTVRQDNVARVDNTVRVDANTGDNDADDNTGANVRVKTGDTDTNISLATSANVNSARIGGGDSEGGEVSARILGNGSHSDNDIYLDFNNDVLLDQDNYANVDNYVDVDADTGWNSADDNTGGDVVLETGNAEANIIVDNLVNFNAADVEGCCVEDLSAKIAGNGTDSENKIDYDSLGDTEAFQDNGARLDNDLFVDGFTGDNDADDNTGEYEGNSDPRVETGNSVATAEVSNESGFNAFGNVELELDWSDLVEWFTNLSN